MGNEILQFSFIISLFTSMFRYAAPIIFSATGELVAERSGVLNLGIEGTMLIGALASFLVTYHTQSLALGVLGGMLVGGLLSTLMAFIVVTLRADQIITGLTVNIFSAGITLYMFRAAFTGVATQNLPTIKTFEAINIPFLSNIPVIGPIFFSQHLLTYIAILMVVLVYLFLYHTKYGLVLRSIGDNPRAVDMKGVNISLYKYLSVIFGGMMSGLGGSFLTLVSAGIFAQEMVNGRGWIALAIVIMGNWKPFTILLSALLFGFLDTFQLQVQGIGIHFPYQILIALPYVLTILVLVIGRRKSGVPLLVGRPYSREES